MSQKEIQKKKEMLHDCGISPLIIEFLKWEEMTKVQADQIIRTLLNKWL